MQFHNEQLKVLKDLFLSYQQNPSEETFLQILERVDRMMIEMVGKFSRIYYFNESVPQLLQDMYQTGIIGLKLAIDSFDPKAEEKSIPIWIFHHIRNELFKTYGNKRFDISRYVYEHPDYLEDPNVDSGLIQEDIRRIIKEAIESGKVLEDDIQLLILKFIENMSVSDILRIFGNRWGSRPTLTKKIEKISKILKREFEEKGFGSS